MILKFQLRYCPALARKPTATPKDAQPSNDKPKPDPFENPSPDLLVAEVPKTNPSHILVLNKYPVIENHFILATKTSKPQTALLESEDLSIAYACLQAWAKDATKDKPRRLFAFFNSGEHSGASQVHRHLQFLPFEDMKGDTLTDWQLLLDQMNDPISPLLSLQRNANLPFLHYATKLSPGISAQKLYSEYTFLLRAAICGSKADKVDFDFDKHEPMEREGEAVISYNLAMTTDMMAILSRRSEAAEVPTRGEPQSSVAINGTILGGTLMVKDEHEWRTLREKPTLLDGMLSEIGYPVSETGIVDKTKL